MVKMVEDMLSLQKRLPKVREVNSGLKPSASEDETSMLKKGTHKGNDLTKRSQDAERKGSKYAKWNKGPKRKKKK